MEPCFLLWKSLNFDFKITAGRRTKLGDYTYRGGRHKITVNGDQNPFAFLVTYLHEVAHLQTFEQHKNLVDPHGAAWKANYSKLIRHFLDLSAFHQSLVTALEGHISNPPASSCADPHLRKELKKFDALQNELPRLPHIEDLPIGQEFLFQGMCFQLTEKQRSRFKAKLQSAPKVYSFNALAEVLPIRKVNGKIESDLQQAVPLIHLPEEASFRYLDREFKKKKQLRVNAVCLELKNREYYEIRSSEAVEVLHLGEC